MPSDSLVKKPLAEPHADLDAAAEAPSYILATGPVARPRRTLKYDDSFLVLDSHGDIGASPGGSDGLFHADTRHLSRLELSLNEFQPLLLGSNISDDNAILTVDLTNPDLFSDKRFLPFLPSSLFFLFLFFFFFFFFFFLFFFLFFFFLFSFFFSFIILFTFYLFFISIFLFTSFL